MRIEEGEWEQTCQLILRTSEPDHVLAVISFYGRLSGDIQRRFEPISRQPRKTRTGAVLIDEIGVRRIIPRPLARGDSLRMRCAILMNGNHKVVVRGNKRLLNMDDIFSRSGSWPGIPLLT
jgi:hypothetical protein